MSKVIAISGMAGAGKSSIAGLLKSKIPNSAIIPLAKPIKDLAYAMGWDGKKDAKGRKLLQTLGTECGRAYNKNMWTDLWANEMAIYQPETVIICDDLRFKSEYNFFRSYSDCEFIHVGGYPRFNLFKHPSERGFKYSGNNVTFIDNYKNTLLWRPMLEERISNFLRGKNYGTV